MLERCLELVPWALLSLLKFAVTPEIMRTAGYGYWETLFTVLIGGSLGVTLFYYSGTVVINYIDAWWPGNRSSKNKPRKSFTRKNKFIVRIKNRFGLYGLAFLTPLLLSIPIGSVLAARFFPYGHKTTVALLVAVVFWSFMLTTFHDFFSAIIGYVSGFFE
ncbi:MAG: hypothetical protein AAGB22_07395 [Bacteroidota bacterium]